METLAPYLDAFEIPVFFIALLAAVAAAVLKEATDRFFFRLAFIVYTLMIVAFFILTILTDGVAMAMPTAILAGVLSYVLLKPTTRVPVT